MRYPTSLMKTVSNPPPPSPITNPLGRHSSCRAHGTPNIDPCLETAPPLKDASQRSFPLLLLADYKGLHERPARGCGPVIQPAWCHVLQPSQIMGKKGMTASHRIG